VQYSCPTREQCNSSVRTPSPVPLRHQSIPAHHICYVMEVYRSVKQRRNCAAVTTLPVRQSSHGLLISEFYENLVYKRETHGSTQYVSTQLFQESFSFYVAIGGIPRCLQFQTSLLRVFRWLVCLCSVHTYRLHDHK
jgi:hypothetical protein